MHAVGALRSYPTYLKPHTVATWLREARPEEEYILIVDSDMIFRRPLLPGALGVQLGVAASQNQWCAVFPAQPHGHLVLSVAVQGSKPCVTLPQACGVEH